MQPSTPTPLHLKAADAANRVMRSLKLKSKDSQEFRAGHVDALTREYLNVMRDYVQALQKKGDG